MNRSTTMPIAQNPDELIQQQTAMYPPAPAPAAAPSSAPAASVPAGYQRVSGLEPYVAPEVTAPASSTAQPSMLSSWYDNYTKNNQNQSAAPAPAAPDPWSVTADQTVQGQLKNVLDSGGPLMQLAETRAKQAANRSGMLNTSMAIGAGQKAVIDSATPIATADAGTYAGAAQQAAGFRQQTALQSQDFAQQSQTQAKDLASREALQTNEIANQQKLQKAQADLQTGLQATDLAVKQSMQTYQLAVQQAMNGQDNETRRALGSLDAQTQTTLAGINNQFRVQLQASQSMAATYQGMVDSISKVMTDPNMDAAAKQAQINNLTTLYNNALGMQSKVTGLDLGSLLNPGDVASTGAPVSPVAPVAPAEPVQPGAYPGGSYSPDLNLQGQG